MNSRLYILFLLILTFSANSLPAQKISAEDIDYFEKKVRPLLVKHCYKCHSEKSKKIKGNLLLDSKKGWQVGGDSGPAIKPGDPAGSLFMKAVYYKDHDLKMPPKYKMKGGDIAILANWIKSGAPDPRRTERKIESATNRVNIEEGRSFWAFRPLKKPPIPQVKDRDWGKSNIDSFLLDKMEKKGLKPAADVNRALLIRRAYFDLTGLPPTPEQIDAFVQNKDPEAFEKMIDRLLAKPEYGERWGRHWLDVTRFAESSGGGRSLMFKEAWRFRDYVIRSFNADKPFNKLIKEHIAGDLLEAETNDERNDNLIGAGYLMLGPINYEQQDKALLKMEVIDEQIDVIGRTFLGMTLGCARCHDHPFDPVGMKDYYGMAGIFKSTLALTPGNVSGFTTQKLDQLKKKTEEEIAWAEKLKRLTAEQAAVEKKINKLGGDPSRIKPSKVTSILLTSLRGIVIDDEDAEKIGTWHDSTYIPGYISKGYIHDQGEAKGKNRVVYDPTIEQGGLYEVRISYTSGGNRASNVPVIIDHQDGRSTVIVNQVEAAPIKGSFISLGIYRFEADTVSKITISNEGTNGVVIADSVQLLPIMMKADKASIKPPKGFTMDQFDKPDYVPFIIQNKDKLEGIVIDDTEAEIKGDWGHSVHTPPFVGRGYIHDKKEGKGEKSVTFRPDIPEDGRYEVRMAHNYNVRRSTNTPVFIKHAGGTDTVIINQSRISPINFLFESLGIFEFKKGKKGTVTISNKGTDGKYVVVDSIQFIRVKEQGSPAEIKALVTRSTELSNQLKALKKKNPISKPPVAMSVKEAEKTADGHIHIRGEVRNLGPVVPRGFLRVAVPSSIEHPPKIADGASGRLELAEWISSPENPLTARVLVNRVWHYLFVEGIVRTVDNFGATGEKPSHPELLDYLTLQFINNGWSVKKLIKEMILTRAYRMSSKVNPAASNVDPENRLMSFAKHKRLEAEPIRDAILQISGQLNETRFGRTIRKISTYDLAYKFNTKRRSVYVPAFRNSVMEIFEAFDQANSNLVTGRRTVSTVPTQSLFMMNSPFVIEEAGHTAKKLLEMKLKDKEKITYAYRLILGRKPFAAELKLSEEYLNGFDNKQSAWSSFCHSLFASVDFRYVY